MTDVMVGGFLRDSVTNALVVAGAGTVDPTALLGALDREKARSQQLVALQDNVQQPELWANMAAWTPSTAANQQVNAGRLFNNAATTSAGMSRALPAGVAAGGHFRAKASIAITLGAASGGVTMIGVSSAAVNNFAANMVGIGFETDTLRPIGWGFGAGGGETYLGTPLAAGTYWVDVIIDDQYVSFALTSAAHGLTEFLFGVPRSSFAPAQLAVWNSDSRNLAGASIGPIGAVAGTPNQGLVSFSPRTVEDVADSVDHTTGGILGADIIRVSIPKSYDSRKPAPLVLYLHGAGETETQMFRDAGVNVCQALNDAGYVVASSTGGGTDAWGNQASLDSYMALYRWLRDRLAIGAVLLLGVSMGALIGLLLAAGSTMPGIAGWCGIYPACNLRAEYDLTFGAAIRAAHGIAGNGSDYLTKTAGRDPVLLTGSAFRKMPMRFYASPADVVVPKATNADMLAANVATSAREAAVVVCSGNHGDPSHYQPADVVSFFNRCIAG